MADQPTVVPQDAAIPASQLGLRITGYLIDVVPACVLGLFGLIPIFGPIIAGLVLAPYWLLRDIAGASLGKLILGTRIITKNGLSARAGARVLRNVPLAVGPAFLIIPFLGYVLGPAISLLAVLIESILLVLRGERLGDRLAKTIVVKK